ncbi:MAG: NAD-dependent epimerase/dehydratase family protein [Acidobacteria bacterium]|nr:NAD-dependent epimerase/dehydratase family protein [Acidobacteriota bacterium]MCI0718388.1 NAD-dependent epimerase/dehydratase family protein [Acidobacteriota bacterium]
MGIADLTSSQVIVRKDLDYICRGLQGEFPELSGKKLLVTGGAGFLGYYLVQAVLHWNQGSRQASPIYLTIYDNYVRGFPDWLARIHNDPNLNLVQHDITQPLPEHLGSFDYVVHAASIASPTYYRKYPIETMDANVKGLRSLLEAFRRQRELGQPVGGILFFSSSEIYGDPTPENIPTPESYRGNVSCTGPRACYDEAKRFGETLCVNFAHYYKLPVKVVRPFNNYGPGLKISDRRVLPDFARDVLAGRDIVVFSDGSPRRTYCYVADAVTGYFKALLRGRPGEAYNIGIDAPEISVLELAERVVRTARELFDYKGTVRHATSHDRDYLRDNPSRRCPDITKARTELGYRPSISIDEGLKRALLWYRDHQVAEDA